jgi:hypothetical protein
MKTDTREIRIEISTLCNYNCTMCPRDSFLRKKEIMSNALFLKILKAVKQDAEYINSLTFSGFGEFSTDPHWKQKLEMAANYFPNIHVLTNLSLITLSDIDFLLHFVKDIRVSIYATTNSTYQEIHKPPSTITLTDIEKKLNYLIYRKNPEQKVILNFLELDKNKFETKDWINKWKDKADIIEAWTPHNWADTKNFRTDAGVKKESCGRPINGPVQVQVDGSVTVCCFDFNGKLVIGDFNNQTFNEIFDGILINRVQQLHSINCADTIDICSKCDQRFMHTSSDEILLFSNYTFDNRINKTSTELEDMTITKNIKKNNIL